MKQVVDDLANYLSMCRRLLIFPGRFQPSIFSASELNCRVRYGNGCTLTAIDTDLYQNP